MVEVVFGDSEKATVKIAKHYSAKTMQHSIIRYFGEKPTKADLQTRYAGQPIGGSPQDVVSIGFALDFGDISSPFPGDGRREAVRQLWGRFGFDAKSYEQFFQTLCDDADKLLNTARAGTPIRAWISHAPYSLCGFYALCDLLADIDCPLSSIFCRILYRATERARHRVCIPFGMRSNRESCINSSLMRDKYLNRN